MNGHLLAETTDKGRAIKTYVWLDSRPLAQLDGKDQGKKTKLVYLHTDHLDTPRLGTDNRGKTVWRWDSDAFGNDLGSTLITQDANEDEDEEHEDHDKDAGHHDQHRHQGQKAIQVNLRFPGQYYDAETGLHFNLQRYYDPKTGRYITSDPIGLLGGVNAYSYTYNNPLKYIDRRGLEVTGQIIDMDVSGVSASDFDWSPNLQELEPGLWQYGTIDFTMSGTVGVKIKCTKTEDGECESKESKSWIINTSVSASQRASIRVKEVETLPPLMSQAVMLMDAIYNAGEYAYQHRGVLKAVARGLINPTLICEGDLNFLVQ